MRAPPNKAARGTVAIKAVFDHPNRAKSGTCKRGRQKVGNGPNTVSGSTVSNTELSEFFGDH